MTQVDALAVAMAATAVHSADDATEAPTVNASSLQPTKPSFASALRSGQSMPSSILTKDDTAPSASSSSSARPPASVDLPSQAPLAPVATVATSTSPCELAPVDDIILQAIRKRDDRIFFSQYENQMAALVRDPTRTLLELGAMNAYQRLLIHRCADQFRLEHRLDRATNGITLSKTAATSQPSALLSVRAREYFVQRDGIDPVNVHPDIANPAAASMPGATNANSPSSSASPSCPASPAPSPAAIQSLSANAPKPGFKIMRRDPSKSRHSPLRSTDDDSNDPDKVAAKARKDMTLEEREASYRAARARIFGDLVTNNSSGSASPTSSTPPLDPCKAIDHVTDAASSSRDTKASPSSSVASSLAASPVAGRSASRSKKGSSSGSSVTTQDSSTQKGRAKPRGKAAAPHSAKDLKNDDFEFSRALPISPHLAASPAFGAHQQSSPLALSGHIAHAYFPAMQQSHSNPDLRSRALALHPQGSNTPAYSHGGGLRHPVDAATQPQYNGLAQSQRLWTQIDEAVPTEASPALGNTVSDANQRHTQTQGGGGGGGGGTWNRSHSNGIVAPAAAGQEHHMHGVGAWAQQVHNNAALRQPQQHNQAYLTYPHQQLQPQQQYFQPAYHAYPQGQPCYPIHLPPMGQQQLHAYAHSNFTAPRSATSSRASSQPGGGAQAARDDAASVGSATASSRSASFSGVSGAGSTGATQLQANGVGSKSNSSSGGNSKPIAALSHPSLPARPAWLSSTGNAASPADSGAQGND
ncbi:hypothetical protein EX895_001208 [Sporisorium graminicola]|uniref:SUZ domain-containing protein n=1 Tax=Sporisorium graminicola TaxID=280036 RepID=A0A4U7KYH5_9BASI|nr:hypothetical protein EX895_001208 [Sporisorium graminicola]TKY89911.1 hypothetical protein EX895_001208 [Sporisorium graminicola]